MDIRVLDELDARLYQELRLNALKNNPEAFGSTYEREVKFSLETVVERMKPTEDKFVFGAFDDGGSLVGIVGFVRESGLKTSHKVNEDFVFLNKARSLMLEVIKLVESKQ